MTRHPSAAATWLASALLLLTSCTMVGMPPGASEPPGAPEPAAAPGAAAGAPPSAADAEDSLPPEGRRSDPSASAPVSRAAGGSGEIRALWVVRTTLAHPDSARAMVRRADEAGFNTLLVQVRGRGDAYYRSRWEPRAEALRAAPPDYDPLELVIREARARGLGVHAWVNTHLVGGLGPLPADPGHLVHASPDWLAVPRELARSLYHLDPADPGYVDAILQHAREHDDQIEGIFTSPSHPGVKAHFRALSRDLLERYDLDGLHLDYARYPTSAFDYSRQALESFRRWVRPRLPADVVAALERAVAEDPLAYVEALPGPWDEFRTLQITDLVRSTSREVRAAAPDLVLSAAVRADRRDALEYRFQDWVEWIDRGLVDAVAPMAYTPDAGLFATWTRDAVERVGGDRVWAGIGMYLNSYGGTLGQIDVARAEGARGVALFSYDWAVAQGEVGALGLPYLQGVGTGAFVSGDANLD